MQQNHQSQFNTSLNLTATLKVPSTPQVPRKQLNGLIHDERVLNAMGIRSPIVHKGSLRRDTVISANGKMNDNKSMYMKQISNTRSNRGGPPLPMIQVDRVSQPRGSGVNSAASIRRANFKAASSVSMEMLPFADYMSNAGGAAQLSQNQEQINRNVRAMKRLINDQKKEEKEKDKKSKTGKTSPPKKKESSVKLQKKKTHTENAFNAQDKKKQTIRKQLTRTKTIKQGGNQKDGKTDDARRPSLTSVFTHKSKGQVQSTANSASSEEDEESQFQNLKRRIGRSKCTIYPDSKLKDAWDWVACFFILYEAVTIPVMVAFRDYTLYMLHIEIAIEVFFFADMFIQFVTGYYDKGVLIMNRKLIAKRYFKQTLLFDAVANIPTHTFMTFEAYIDLKISSDMLNVFRLVKLLRIYKMGFFGQKIFDYIVSDFLNLIVNFVTMMSNILVIAHWSACLFCYSGTVNTGAKTWIQQAHLVDTSDTEKYINAMYFSITTMATIGYGDIRPYNTGEFIVVIFLELVAGIAFAYMIGKIGSLFQRYNLLAETYGEKVQFVLQFLTLRNIPKDLRMKIKRYLDYNFEMKKDLKIEEEEVYSFLNDDLKSRITVFMNGKILQSVNVFSEFPLDFLSNLTFILGKKNFAMEEYIFNEGDDGKDIYFITQGKVCLIHRQSYSYIIDLEKEQSFGEIGFFSDCQRQVTVKSRDYTDCLTVNLIEFLNIAQTYSEISISIFHKISGAIDTWKKDFSPLKIKCYICSSSKHISVDCPMFKNKMRGNIAHIIKQQSKKDQFGTEMGRSGETTPRSPQRHRSTLRMPVVSPALSREITMKVRDELGADSKIGNWRSIINLQPIGIEQLGGNEEIDIFYDQGDEEVNRQRMNSLLKAQKQKSNGGARRSSKIPYHQSSKDGRFEMISEKRLGGQNEDYSDHRSFSSDSSFEDYSNKDSNQDDINKQPNKDRSFEVQNLDEDDSDKEKVYLGSFMRPKFNADEQSMDLTTHPHFQHFQGNLGDGMMNNDVLQLDEIEEIKEESGESIYSEMDNFSRKKRRGTLLGIEQNRIMMVNQMKKSSRKLISQNNLAVASTLSLQKSQTQISQALQQNQNRGAINEKRLSNQIQTEKLRFNNTPGKGEYQTQTSLQKFQPISPLHLNSQNKAQLPMQTSFKSNKDVKSLKNHLMDITRGVSSTLMKAAESEYRENSSTDSPFRTFHPSPLQLEKAKASSISKNQQSPQLKQKQTQLSINSKHSSHNRSQHHQIQTSLHQNAPFGKGKIPDFSENHYFDLEAEGDDNGESSTMSKVMPKSHLNNIPQSRIAMAIKPIAGIKQKGNRNLAKALHQIQSSELSVLDGYLTYRAEDYAKEKATKIQNHHAHDQGKTMRSIANTYTQNFSDDSSINSQLFYLPQNKNNQMLSNAQSQMKNKNLSLEMQSDYYNSLQQNKNIAIASPYHNSRKGTFQQPQELRSSIRSPARNLTQRAQSSIGSLTKRSQRKTITVIRPTEEIEEEEDEKFDQERQFEIGEKYLDDEMIFDDQRHQADDSISKPDFDLDNGQYGISGQSYQMGQGMQEEAISTGRGSVSMSINGRARTGSQNSKKARRILEFQMEQKKIDRDSSRLLGSTSARGNQQPETNVEFNFQNFVNFKITMADLDADDDDASSLRSQTLFPQSNIQSNVATQVPNSVNGDGIASGPLVQGSHEVIVDNISYKFNYQAK